MTRLASYVTSAASAVAVLPSNAPPWEWIITPVVAFYLLCDWNRVVLTVDGWIPRQHRDTIHALLHDMDAAIAGFVRGQALICLILAAFYAIGLTLCGLNSGFLIGLMTGLFSFIPFVGAATGFLVAAIIAVAQFWPDWMSMGLVILVFVIGQGLEGYVLSPNLVGAKVERVLCDACHTMRGGNGLVHLTATWTDDQMRLNIAKLQRTKGFMPPFAGNADDVESLVQLLRWEIADAPGVWPSSNDPASLGRPSGAAR